MQIAAYIISQAENASYIFHLGDKNTGNVLKRLNRRKTAYA